MGIIPMLVDVLRDGKRVEKALAAELCTSLAKERINRYVMAEVPELLLLAGKCLEVKVRRFAPVRLRCATLQMSLEIA